MVTMRRSAHLFVSTKSLYLNPWSMQESSVLTFHAPVELILACKRLTC